MVMPMVRIRIVRMRVCNCTVFVPMAVRPVWSKVRTVFMLMVLIVRMQVLVFFLNMGMLVFMSFSQMKPYSQSHESKSQQQIDC